MKSKGQLTSESEAKEKLIIFVYEYLIHNNCRPAADLFKEGIQYHKDIKLTDSEGPGFLYDWWCVFWDLYCASPERRHTNAQASSEAQAYHDFTSQMSPQIGHSITSPNPQQFIGGGPRHGPPPHGQPRGPGPRMQVPPPQGHPGGPHGPGGPPSGFIPSGSPRYAQHPSGPAGPPPQPHMNQPIGPMFGPGPEQMGPSPGLNRMTPGGPPSGPPQQAVVGPPQQPPQMVGMPGQPQMVGPQPGQGPPQMNPMQPSGPPRNGSQPGSSAGGGWQGGNVNYNVNSPANQPCYQPGGPGSNQPPNQVGGPMMMNEAGGMMEVKSSPAVNGGEPSTPRSHTDEYVMPVTFGQDTNEQCDSAEILKLKQDMQQDMQEASKIYDPKEGEYCLSTEFTDNGREWKPQ